MPDTLLLVLKSGTYVLLVVLASPLLEGIMRRVKARVHSRKGPPLRQPYLDLAKLFTKEDLAADPGIFARYAPAGAFAAVLAASAFVPLGVQAPAGGAGDLFTFVGLMTLASVLVMAAGLAQTSPFSHLGSIREMLMLLGVEAVLLVSLLTLALAGGTALLSELMRQGPFRISTFIGLLCYLLALQAVLGKLPFDIPEAEQELMEGPFTEYSGPSLALFKWTFFMKQLVFSSLLFTLFLGWPGLPQWGWLGSLLSMAAVYVSVVVLVVVVALVDATNPRLRIDQSLRFFGGLLLVSLVGIGLAAAGL